MVHKTAQVKGKGNGFKKQRKAGPTFPSGGWVQRLAGLIGLVSRSGSLPGLDHLPITLPITCITYLLLSNWRSPKHRFEIHAIYSLENELFAPGYLITPLSP